MFRPFDLGVGPHAELQAQDELHDDLEWDNEVLMEAPLDQLVIPSPGIENPELTRACGETNTGDGILVIFVSNNLYSPH